MSKQSTMSRLFDACSEDYDYEVLERLALSAGIMWRCDGGGTGPCGYINNEESKKCDDCGTRRTACEKVRS